MISAFNTSVTQQIDDSLLKSVMTPNRVICPGLLRVERAACLLAKLPGVQPQCNSYNSLITTLHCIHAIVTHTHAPSMSTNETAGAPAAEFSRVSSCRSLDSNQPRCRLCWGGEDEGGQLISPCQCRGSMEFVHFGCLQVRRSRALVCFTNATGFRTFCDAVCTDSSGLMLWDLNMAVAAAALLTWQADDVVAYYDRCIGMPSQKLQSIAVTVNLLRKLSSRPGPWQGLQQSPPVLARVQRLAMHMCCYSSTPAWPVLYLFGFISVESPLPI
jgi:hypothetical protein